MKPRAFLTLLLLIAMPAAGRACTVCFGAPGSPENDAVSYAIAFLLAVVFFVLGCIGAFAFYLYRQSRNPLSSHDEFVGALDS